MEVTEGRADSTAQQQGWIDATLGLCLAVTLGLQAWLATAMEINWDEFYFLSLIYDYQRGELATAPQTFHVHLLGWLTSTGGDEIRQIVTGRYFMLACEVATCASIYALCRMFFTKSAALMATLAYAAAGYTIVHGASFRADPLSAALAMVALLLMARGRLSLSTAALVAAAAALATLVTVKVLFLAPAFAGLAWWRWSIAASRPQVLRWLIATIAIAAMIIVLLYSAHSSSLPATTAAMTQRMMGSAAQTTIFESGFFPRVADLGNWIIQSPVQAALLVLGAAMAAAAAFRESGQIRRRSVTLLMCAAPLLSLLFYRNAYPYFLAFILPPACVLIALACEPSRFPSKYLPWMAAIMMLSSATVSVVASYREQDAQRDLVAAVHQIFPEPVAYIDRNGMIGSFPKRGFFMSTWGRLNYRRGGPVFADILAREPVPLLLINSPAIEHAVGLRGPVTPHLALFPEDRAALQLNYIPHWGLVWVAGYRVGGAPAEARLQVGVPGTYTLEGGTAEINGRTIHPGGTVVLERGMHRVRSPQPVTLRWGNHLQRPTRAPSDRPLFIGF